MKSNEVAESFSTLLNDMWSGKHHFVNPELFLVLILLIVTAITDIVTEQMFILFIQQALYQVSVNYERKDCTKQLETILNALDDGFQLAKSGNELPASTYIIIATFNLT